jgi:hypothetical protein
MYFIYHLIQNKNNRENLDILYETPKNNIEDECVRRELMDSDFFKKIYSIDDKEIIFF